MSALSRARVLLAGCSRIRHLRRGETSGIAYSCPRCGDIDEALNHRHLLRTSSSRRRQAERAAWAKHAEASVLRFDRSACTSMGAHDGAARLKPAIDEAQTGSRMRSRASRPSSVPDHRHRHGAQQFGCPIPRGDLRKRPRFESTSRSGDTRVARSLRYVSLNTSRSRARPAPTPRE